MRPIDDPCSPDRAARLSDRLEDDWDDVVQAIGAGARKPGDLTLPIRIRAVRVAARARSWGDLATAANVSERALGIASALDCTRTSRRVCNQLVAWVNAYLRPDAPITTHDFLTRRCSVAEFIRWLQTNRAPRRVWDSFLPDQKVGFAVSDDRQRTVDEVVAFMARADVRSIKVVHQAGMAEGLRLLAHHLIHNRIPAHPELSECDVCYLPVTRLPDHERITFPRLVGYLQAFYAGKSPKEADTPKDAAALRDALDEIRRRMTSRPAILILDGHSALRGSLRELQALVSDDALTALLREIVHPLVGPLQPGVTAQTFYRNRFLILADHDLEVLSAYRDESAQLQNPPPGVMPSLFAAQGRANHKELAEVYAAWQGMHSDAAISLADATISLRRLQGLPLDLKATDLHQAYEELVAELGRGGHQVALFALRMAAVLHGGVRYRTFVRLIDQWRKLQPNSLPSHALPAVTFDEVADLLEPLGGVLVHGGDERVPGLDELTEPYVHLDDERTPPPASEDDRLRAFDLSAADLREVIVDELARRDGQSLHLMQRLLAEEGLRQQTHIMRHAEWRGTADVRYYRRLFQLLFHGIASLGGGPDATFVTSDDAPTVLPKHPHNVFRRLYAVFFKTLLEHGPHFDLSRSLGRDALKVDLILVILNAGRQWNRVRSSVYGPDANLSLAHPEFLPMTGDLRANAEMLIDQLLALARAAHQIDDLDLAARSLVQAENVCGAALDAAGRDNRFVIRVTEQQLRARKIAIDVNLERGTGDTERLVDDWLKTAAFYRPGQGLDPDERISDPGSGLDPDPAATLRRQAPAALLDAIAVEVRKTVDPKMAERVLRELTERVVASETSRDASAEELANWSDLLCRRAELRATKANEEGGQQRVRAMFDAFIVFYVAERIRREAFDREPLGRTYVVNGHATRAHVRLSLQILRGLAAFDPAGMGALRNLPDQRFFVTHARRHIDLLTRYSARYPSERPSLLMLQASFTRSVLRPTPGARDAGRGREEEAEQREKREAEQRKLEENYLAALSLLGEADRLMFTTPDRPRVRRRLLLERAKLLRDLAENARAMRSASKLEEAARWWELAFYDLARIKRLLNHTRTGAWDAAYGRELRRVLDLQVQLGLDLDKLSIAKADRSIVGA